MNPLASSLLCIEVTLLDDTPGADELVEAALWDLGPDGVERQDDTTFSQLVEDPRPRTPGTVRWRIYLEDGDEREAAAYDDAVGGMAAVAHWRLHDLSFLTAWREFFKPSRVSPRIWIHPPWEAAPGTDGVRVEIEPGMAFGTGTHETTRLCLAALDECVRPECSVLDVGCGSGVLAIAAAKLGAERVVAIDNDPDAVAVATENAARNGVAVDTSDVDVADPELGSFDIVVANILPHVLIDLSDALLARLGRSGTLVLSGIIREKADDVARHFAGVGLRVAAIDTQGDWSCVRCERPDA